MIYKRLGDYIQPVNNRNKDLEVKTLLGVSIKKVLMPSIANTIGTNMKTYKIIEKNQFAYGPVTSRNGDKISIALLEDFEKAIVSQAYTVFKVSDEQEVLPQYLMMWFRRPEFDRFARFKSHGSAREVFDWEELCDTQLPIPSREKQQQIVAEYNTVTNRIQLNEKINTNLEATAQALYKHWFVDFEFPNAEGKPYKSSGGEMMYNEVLDKDIPVGWTEGTFENIYKFQYGIGNTNPNNYGQYPIYGAGGIIGGYDKFNSEDAPVIGHMGAYCGKVTFAFGKHFVTYNGVICIVKNTNLKWFSYLSLLSKDLMSNTRGSSQPFVSYDMLYEAQIILPKEHLSIEFDILIKEMLKNIKVNLAQNKTLQKLQSLLLAKMTQVVAKARLV